MVSQRRKAKDLSVEEDRFKALFEQSLDAVYIGTLDGRLIDVNQAWLDMFGYRRDDLGGIRATNLYANPAERTDLLDRIRTEGVVRDEVHARRKDGSVFLCQRSMVAHRDASGNVVAIQGVNRDVTALKSAEDALRRSEEHYRSLFEESLDAVYIGRPDGSIVDVNRAWLNLFGYTRDDLPHVRAVDFYVDPHERADFLRRMSESGYVRDEVVYKRKDGTRFICQRAMVGRRDASGAIIELQGINRDISSLSAAEDALHESERRFRSLFEQSMDAIYVVGPDGSSVEANRAWLDLLGYSREDLARLKAADVYADPADRETFLRRIAESGYVKDEVRFRRKDGVVLDCERTVVAIKDDSGAIVAYQGVSHDITQRKKAARALAESEEKYRALFEHTRDAIALVSPGGLLLEANGAYLELFGYLQEDIGSLNVEGQYVDPEDRTRLLDWLSNHDVLVDDEVRLRTRDGAVMDCLRTVVVRRDVDGNVVGEQAVIRDVTETKRAERALKESQERYRMLFEQSMDAIYIGTPVGDVLDVNQAWLELFGFEREELPGLKMADRYVNPSERKEFLRRMSTRGFVNDEVRFKRKDGTEFDCERTVAVRRDTKGAIVAFQGIMRDVTERNRNQAMLERLARYDALTGLLNRRAIVERLGEWLHHARRYSEPLSVVILDLDHFKMVNDLHGHQAGDAVLKATADMLQQSTRKTDIVGRYGGEEFLVILPRTDSDGAIVMAERMRTKLQGTPVDVGCETPLGITASLGISPWCLGDSDDALIGRADAALYRAKAGGRNRVEVEAPPESKP